MHNVITAVIVLISVLQSYSQEVCSRTVTDFGASSGDYLIEGTATLTDSGGTLFLMLSSDFFTDSGPDLYLYLSINDEAPTVLGNTHVEVAQLMSNSGAQSYIVPGNYNLDDFNYVLVHCKQFNHFWDGGSLDVEICDLPTGLEEDGSVEDQIVANSLFSAFTKFKVRSLKNTSYRLTIYSVNGTMMRSSAEMTNADIYLGDDFPSGVYVIRAVYGNRLLTSKIIKQ